jgi:hypothetical protein
MTEANFLDKLIDWNLDKLPKDPLTQTKYMYYLNTIIIVTLISFTISNLYQFFFNGFVLSYLFGAMLTGVFSLMSLFSYKATRESYQRLKGMSQGIQEEITPERIEEELKKRIMDIPVSTQTPEELKKKKKVPSYV